MGPPPSHNEPKILRSTMAGVASLVQALLTSGQLQRAEEILTGTPNEGRESLEFWQLWAEFLWKAGRLDELDRHLGNPSDLQWQEQSTGALWWLYRTRLGYARAEYREVVSGLEQFLGTLPPGRVAPNHVARLHLEAAICWHRLRELEPADRHLHSGLALYERVGDQEGVADCLLMLGMLAKAGSHWGEAEALVSQALRIYSDLGSTTKVLTTTTNLGVLRLFRGQFVLAESPLRRAVHLAQELSDAFRSALGHANHGLLCVRQLRFGQARRELLRAYLSARRGGLLRVQGLSCEYLGELALAEGRWKQARLWLQRSYRLVQHVPERDIMFEARCRLAEVELAEGNPEEALRIIRECIVAFESMQDLYELAVCRRVEGQVLLAMGRRAEAVTTLEQCLDFFAQMGEQFESFRAQRLLEATERGEPVPSSDQLPRPSSIPAEGDSRIAARGYPGEVLDSAAAMEAMDEAGGIEAPSAVAGPSNRRRIRARESAVPKEHPDFPGVLGQSVVLLAALDEARRAASLDSTVLVLGETGTGKELLAQAIHKLSPRFSREFVPFNCGCGTPELLDAELFGHVKGSFTGAHGNRPGLVRRAAGGTLFLDEIAELPLDSQPRLLRLLDSGEVRPVGSDEIEQVDVRVISATHQDLRRRVAEGLFRRDLFYRLSVVRIQLPPLRDRMEDLPLLVDHFAGEARRRGRPGFLGVSADVQRQMAAYTWPGNLRELRNAVLQLAGQSSKGEFVQDWQPDHDALKDGVDLPEVGVIDRPRLEAELRAARGNVSIVAERLGITRQKLYRVLQQFKLRPSGYR